MGFPGVSDGKESACNAGDPGSIPGSGKSPGEGHGNPPSTLAWRIPWTEEPGGPQSIELQRGGHNYMTEQLTLFLLFGKAHRLKTGILPKIFESIIQGVK